MSIAGQIYWHVVGFLESAGCVLKPNRSLVSFHSDHPICCVLITSPHFCVNTSFIGSFLQVSSSIFAPCPSIFLEIKSRSSLHVHKNTCLCIWIKLWIRVFQRKDSLLSLYDTFIIFHLPHTSIFQLITKFIPTSK